MPNILVVDDHPLFRKALVSVLTRAVRGTRCREVQDVDGLMEAIRAQEFDLVLLDLFLPGVQGFACMAALRARLDGVPVVIISGSRDPEVVQQARLFGAAGFLHKSLPEERIAEAVRTVIAGGTCFPDEPRGERSAIDEDGEGRLASLTRRQAATLQLLGRGLSNKEIARALNVSHETVKAHISAILRKLQVGSRTEAVVVAHHLMDERQPDV